jgi:signal transduction histidine kinase
MSELPPPAASAEHRDVRRHASPPAHAPGGIESLHLWVSVLPAVVMALLGSATVAFLLAANPSTSTTRVVLAVAVAGIGLVLFAAAYGASAATRRVHQSVRGLRSLSARGQEDLQWLVEKLQRGERPTQRDAEGVPAEESDPFGLLARDLRRDQYAAQRAVLHIAGSTSGGSPDQRVEVFVNLARRMQSLVHREIQLLDNLEAQVEDPDLLKGLFAVDHLATRMRRQSESLAVLGGAASRRQWSRPVTLHEMLRASVAEVEQYSRVKVVPPVEGSLHGNAVADVIHLVAELIENATKFSAPQAQVLLRVQSVTAGLAIEVEDRGLGMPSDDQCRMNDLLADPGRINIGELLRDGRIGLFVVSALARRHGIKVQLQNNIYGGIQAVVVVPKGLIDSGSPDRSQDQQDHEPQRQTRPARPDALPQRVPQASAPNPPTPPRHARAPRPDEPAPIAARGNGLGQGPGSLEPRPDAQPRERDSMHRPVPPAPAVPAAEPAGQEPADDGDRPALPQRSVQTHLAPQLQDAPAARRNAPVADHTPGLMAAFQGGVNRAQDEDDPSDRD